MTSRVQVGVRFEYTVWSSFRVLAKNEGRQANQLLESVMRAAVESGSTKVLDSVNMSDGIVLSEAVQLHGLLAELGRFVDHAWFEYFQWKSKAKETGGVMFPSDKNTEIERRITDILPLLRQQNNSEILELATRTLGRARQYQAVEFPFDLDHDKEQAEPEPVESVR